jgi:hypothetical protein
LVISHLLREALDKALVDQVARLCENFAAADGSVSAFTDGIISAIKRYDEARKLIDEILGDQLRRA